MLMSICSKRLSYLVKLGRNRIDNVHIHLKTGDLQLEVNRTSKDFCDFRFNSNENEVVPKGCEDLSEWFQNGNSDVLNFIATVSIEDVLSVFNRLCSDFRVGRFCWKLFPEELKDRNLKDLISTLDFGNCFKVSVIKGEIDTETLSFLIERMDSKIILRITSEIPSNFQHPRALDFSEIEYEDARWLTVNDLKTIRNGSFVGLTGRTNFDNEDINELIKYWTECKEKMFTRLTIKLRDGVKVNEVSIVREVISCSNSMKRYYYLSKKLIQTHSIGSVEFSNGLVTLISWPFDSQLEYMVPILMLLEQKFDLTMSYSGLIKEERELYVKLEAVEDEEGDNELEQEIVNIDNEKKNVEAEFYKTVEKLRALQITNFNEYLEPIP
ncbi:unnamed protein product [Caenorhabditis brenneri]